MKVKDFGDLDENSYISWQIMCIINKKCIINDNGIICIINPIKIPASTTAYKIFSRNGLKIIVPELKAYLVLKGTNFQLNLIPYMIAYKPRNLG